MVRKEYLVIVDPGKKRDPTAIMVMRDNYRILDGSPTAGIQDRAQHFYEIVLIEKLLEVRYTEVCDIVSVICNHTDIKNNHELLVDGTGVGEPVVDIMREKYLVPIPIVFTGGNAVNEIYQPFGKVFGGSGKLQGANVLKEIRVPKDDLVTAGQVLIQQRRVNIADGLKFADDFKRQLHAFRGKVNENGVKHEALTEAIHDDLVVCYLMGAWWFTRQRKTDEIVIPYDKPIQDWNPMDYL